MTTRAAAIASLLLSLAIVAPASRAEPAPAAAPTNTQDLRWIRSRQDENRVLRLQLAIREFVPKRGDGPAIVLHGAVHIADRSFYKRLEETLEADHDAILFEGVKPGGMSAAPLPEGVEGDHARTVRTKERLRLAWTFIERWKRSSKESGTDLPFDLLAVRKRMAEEGHPREQAMLAKVSDDGWGRQFVFTRSTDGRSYTLGSLGKDGTLGGDGPDQDTWTTDLTPLNASELSDAPGLQKRLAETFGLAFQLEEMAHAGPKWINADMSIDEVQEALGFGGDAGDEGERNMLFALLDGSSLPAKVASMLLGLVEAIPGMAPRMKVMMLEMLANVDESALSNASFPGMGDMKEMMKVIIEDRNQVVIDDLRRTIKEHPEYKRVAVLYGAGHLPDLARRLEDQLGYTHKSGKWITAIRVNLDAEGISDEEMAMTRSMMATQMKMLSAQGKAAGKGDAKPE